MGGRLLDSGSTARALRTLGATVVLLAILGAPVFAAQMEPSSDPTPFVLILIKLDRGDTEGASRLLKENLPVTKTRLEGVLAEIDRKFDELGRSGATNGHDVHKEVIQALLDEYRRYGKLFDLYSSLSGDKNLPKRFTARMLRIEGAYYTHAGEDACGDDLNWDEAQRLYRTAMERLEAGFALAKETNDARVMASAKNNMGSTLIRLLKPEEAIQAYQEGLRLSEQVPGDMYKGLVRMNLGNTYVWIGQPDESLAYLQPALAGFKRMGRVTWQANAVMTIGNAYLRQQKFSDAWENLSLALEMAKQSGEDRVRGRALLNLGMAGLQLKKPDAARYVQEALEWYSKQASDVYTPIEREVVLQDGYRLLSRIAKDAGDEAAAEKYTRQFYEAIGPDPDRYGTLRASPCYAIYQGRPAGEFAQRR